MRTPIFFNRVVFSTPNFAFEFDNVATARLRERMVADDGDPYIYPPPRLPTDRPGFVPLSATPFVAAIPEPASLGLLATALIALGLLARPRQHASHISQPIAS